MASPPFVAATTTPADNAIVSQFPLAERTFRDLMDSWLKIDHDTNGHHIQVSYVTSGVAPTFTAGILGTYASTDGTFYKVLAGGTPEIIGPPPGSVMEYWGTTAPAGWLLMYGQAVSRSTYAALFAVISTVGGVGDGSTTFNIPDRRGYVAVGKDNMGGSAISRVTTAGSGVDGLTLGAVGGAENITLDTTMIPSHLHAKPALTDPGHQHLVLTGSGVSGTLGPSNTLFASANYGNDNSYILLGSDAAASGGLSSLASTGITLAASTGLTGGGLAHNNMPPSRVVNFIIKT